MSWWPLVGWLLAAAVLLPVAVCVTLALQNLAAWLTLRWRCHRSWMPGRWAHRHDAEWLAAHRGERRWQLLRHLLDSPPRKVGPKR